MLEYIDTVKIRPGFEEFLDKMAEKEIPVVVISGGFRQFSSRKLAPYMDKIAALHTVEMTVEGDKIKLVSQHDDGNELLKKTDVMKKYSMRMLSASATAIRIKIWPRRWIPALPATCWQNTWTRSARSIVLMRTFMMC